MNHTSRQLLQKVDENLSASIKTPNKQFGESSNDRDRKLYYLQYRRRKH